MFTNSPKTLDAEINYLSKEEKEESDWLPEEGDFYKSIIKEIEQAHFENILGILSQPLGDALSLQKKQCIYKLLHRAVYQGQRLPGIVIDGLILCIEQTFQMNDLNHFALLSRTLIWSIFNPLINRQELTVKLFSIFHQALHKDEFQDAIIFILAEYVGFGWELSAELFNRIVFISTNSELALQRKCIAIMLRHLKNTVDSPRKFTRLHQLWEALPTFCIHEDGDIRINSLRLVTLLLKQDLASKMHQIKLVESLILCLTRFGEITQENAACALCFISNDVYFKSSALVTYLEKSILEKSSEFAKEALQHLMQQQLLEQSKVAHEATLRPLSAEGGSQEKNLVTLLKEIDRLNKNNKSVAGLLKQSTPTCQTVETVLPEKKDQGSLPATIADSLMLEDCVLAEQYRLVESALDSDSVITPMGVPIRDWNEAHFKHWASHIHAHPTSANHPAHLFEITAATCKAIQLTTGFYLRTIQILALLLLLDGKVKGRLAQIKTGEGKTFVIAGFAAIKALQGKKVDVISSSSVLASRDVKQTERLFNLLNISVGDCCDELYPDNLTKPKECYAKAQVVYGSIFSFQWDRLRWEYYGKGGGRGDRPYDTVIIDEADVLLIEECNRTGLLAKHTPLMESLAPLMVAIWKMLLDIHSRIKFTQGQWVYHMENEDDSFEVPNVAEFIQATLEKYIIKLVDDTESPFILPQHLKPVALQQAKTWARSAYEVRFIWQCGKNYIIAEDNNIEIIATVDHDNTGTVSHTLKWSHGLDEFLRIKHGLTIIGESFSSCFVSNLGYFKRYEERVFGLTGTFGNEDSCTFLQEVYQVDLVFVPTFSFDHFYEQPCILADNVDEWLGEICACVQRELANDRAVWIICETINDLNQIEKSLLSTQSCLKRNLRRYSRNDTDEVNAVNEELHPGDVMLASNLGGRGTDPRISAALEKNEGLHVCITFLPRNSRTEKQAFGRTARRDNEGSGQLILNKQKIAEFFNCDPESLQHATIKDIKDWRDKKESRRIAHFKSNEVPIIQLKDKLVDLFYQFRAELAQKNNCPELLDDLDEQWGVWLMPAVQKMYTNGPDHRIMQEFKQFKASQLIAFTKGIIRNPIRYIKIGNATFQQALHYEVPTEELARMGTYLDDLSDNSPIRVAFKAGEQRLHILDEAYKAYTRAIETDPTYSIQAYYNRAFVRIAQLGWNSPLGWMTKTDLSLQDAADDLCTTKSNIEECLIPQLQSMLIIYTFDHPFEDALKRQIHKKIDLLNHQISLIDRALDIIRNSPGGVRITRFFDYKEDEVFKAEFKSDGSEGAELLELSHNGLHHLFEIESIPLPPPKKKKNSFWGSIGCAILGIAQIVCGAALFVTGNVYLGTALISEGVSDLFYSVMSAIDGDFSWEAYKTHKFTSLAVTAISMGFQVVREAAIAARTTNPTRTALLGHQVGHLNRTELMQIAKDRVKTAIITSGVRETANVAINYITKQAMKDFKDELAEVVRKIVYKHLNQVDVRDNLNAMIIMDVLMQNPRRNGWLRSQVTYLIAKHSHQCTSIAESIAKGVLARQHAMLAQVIKLIDLGKTIDQITSMTEDFCHDFAAAVLSVGQKSWDHHPLIQQDLQKIDNIREELLHFIIDALTKAMMSRVRQGIVNPLAQSVLSRPIANLTHRAEQAINDIIKPKLTHAENTNVFLNRYEVLHAESKPSILVAETTPAAKVAPSAQYSNLAHVHQAAMPQPKSALEAPLQNVIDATAASLTSHALASRHHVVSHTTEHFKSAQSIVQDGVALKSYKQNLYGGRAFYVAENGYSIHEVEGKFTVAFELSGKTKIYDVSQSNHPKPFGTKFAKHIHQLDYDAIKYKGNYKKVPGRLNSYNLAIINNEKYLMPIGIYPVPTMRDSAISLPTIRALQLGGYAGTAYALYQAQQKILASDHPMIESAHQGILFSAATLGGAIAGTQSILPCAAVGTAFPVAAPYSVPICIASASVFGGAAASTITELGWYVGESVAKPLQKLTEKVKKANPFGFFRETNDRVKVNYVNGCPKRENQELRYRRDTRPPQIIFEKGFNSWASENNTPVPNENLGAHVNGETTGLRGGSKTSIYISTTTSRAFVENWTPPLSDPNLRLRGVDPLTPLDVHRKFLYEILPQPTEIEVSPVLLENKENKFNPEQIAYLLQQKEMAVPHHIPPQDILGVCELKSSNRSKERYAINPNFVSRDTANDTQNNESNLSYP